MSFFSRKKPSDDSLNIDELLVNDSMVDIQHEIRSQRPAYQGDVIDVEDSLLQSSTNAPTKSQLSRKKIIVLAITALFALGGVASIFIPSGGSMPNELAQAVAEAPSQPVALVATTPPTPVAQTGNETEPKPDISVAATVQMPGVGQANNNQPQAPVTAPDLILSSTKISAPPKPVEVKAQVTAVPPTPVPSPTVAVVTSQAPNLVAPTATQPPAAVSPALVPTTPDAPATAVLPASLQAPSAVVTPQNQTATPMPPPAAVAKPATTETTAPVKPAPVKPAVAAKPPVEKPVVAAKPQPAKKPAPVEKQAPQVKEAKGDFADSTPPQTEAVKKLVNTTPAKYGVSSIQPEGLIFEPKKADEKGQVALIGDVLPNGEKLIRIDAASNTIVTDRSVVRFQ